MGRIYIGANAVIGANTVVVKDVPPHATVVAPRSRTVRIHSENGDVSDEPS
jgi:serine acetyltransferase